MIEEGTRVVHGLTFEPRLGPIGCSPFSLLALAPLGCAFSPAFALSPCGAALGERKSQSSALSTPNSPTMCSVAWALKQGLCTVISDLQCLLSKRTKITSTICNVADTVHPFAQQTHPCSGVWACVSPPSPVGFCALIVACLLATALLELPAAHQQR